jgi:2-polyprenyl-6-hydroxyphenyl methylase/3-demethylubiquinone-9 3-methyltransferase
MLLAELNRLRPRRFLEVAANDGSLSACAALNGSEVVCNDLRAEHLSNALQTFTTAGKIRVEGGNLFDLKPESVGTFDLIAANEVIEHVAHPDELLKHLKTLLSPGGRLLMTTPNGSHLRNKLPTFSQVKDFDSLEAIQFQPDADGHLFLFTSKELAELAKATGYEVEHLSAWGAPLLTGHCGLARFARPSLTSLAYRFENIVQRLPLRDKLCFSLFAVFKAKTQQGIR